MKTIVGIKINSVGEMSLENIDLSATRWNLKPDKRHFEGEGQYTSSQTLAVDGEYGYVAYHLSHYSNDNTDVNVWSDVVTYLEVKPGQPDDLPKEKVRGDIIVLKHYIPPHTRDVVNTEDIDLKISEHFREKSMEELLEKDTHVDCNRFDIQIIRRRLLKRREYIDTIEARTTNYTTCSIL